MAFALRSTLGMHSCVEAVAAAAAAAAAYLQPLIFADLTRLGDEDEDGVEEVEMMC